MTAPLRYLTKQQVKFKWKEEMEKDFQEIKTRLCGDRVWYHTIHLGTPECTETQAQRELKQLWPSYIIIQRRVRPEDQYTTLLDNQRRDISFKQAQNLCIVA